MSIPEALLVIILLDPSGSGRYRDYVFPVQTIAECDAKVSEGKANLAVEVGPEAPFVIYCAPVRKVGEKAV